MNSLTLEDVCYQIHPTVKFYRHKSNGMLTADIRLETKADGAAPFTMSIQKMPTDLTTVKALEGKSFTFDIHCNLAGFIIYKNEYNYADDEDKIEFLKVTDDKVVIKWGFYASESFYEYRYEVIFEADYEIEDTEEEYPFVYSSFEPAEGEINYLNIDGMRYATEAKIEFSRDEDGMLLMNLDVEAKTKHNHLKWETEELPLYTEELCLCVTDITELKGKVFDSDEINGVVFALESEGNTDETMEILGVTDDHLLIRWSGYCSIEYGLLGSNIPFEAVFEAKYVDTAEEKNEEFDDDADATYGFVESDDSCEQTEEPQAEFTPPNITMDGNSIRVEIVNDLSKQMHKKYEDVFDVSEEAKYIHYDTQGVPGKYAADGSELILKKGWNEQFDSDTKLKYFAYGVSEGGICSTKMSAASALTPKCIHNPDHADIATVCKLYCLIDNGKITNQTNQFNDGTYSEFCGPFRMFQALDPDGIALANVVITKESDFANFIEQTKQITTALKTKAIVFEIMKCYHPKRQNLQICFQCQDQALF